MDEERVKSALEIAMERLSSLPELTPEEIAHQKEEQFRPVGQAIGRRYLTGMIDERGMGEELDRQGAESGGIARSACISILCASIRLEDVHASGKAITGLCSLAQSPAEFRQEANSSWDRLWNAYKKREVETIGKFESAALKTFASIGISGSAIRPNVSENDSLQDEIESLRRSFDVKLEALRSTLMGKICKSGG